MEEEFSGVEAGLDINWSPSLASIAVAFTSSLVISLLIHNYEDES